MIDEILDEISDMIKEFIDSDLDINMRYFKAKKFTLKWWIFILISGFSIVALFMEFYILLCMAADSAKFGGM